MTSVGVNTQQFNLHIDNNTLSLSGAKLANLRLKRGKVAVLMDYNLISFKISICFTVGFWGLSTL